jgi:hypothetical protein
MLGECSTIVIHPHCVCVCVCVCVLLGFEFRVLYLLGRLCTS